MLATPVRGKEPLLRRNHGLAGIALETIATSEGLNLRRVFDGMAGVAEPTFKGSGALCAVRGSGPECQRQVALKALTGPRPVRP